MAENKNSNRVELNDETLDVAGGRFSLGEAMGEAQKDKLQGGDGNFFLIWLKNLFKNNNTVAGTQSDPLTNVIDSVVDDNQKLL